MGKVDFKEERSHSSSVEEKASVAYEIHVKDAAHAVLSPSHEEYFVLRHKTLDLYPLLAADPVNTLNWPTWKVRNPFLTRFLV